MSILDPIFSPSNNLEDTPIFRTSLLIIFRGVPVRWGVVRWEWSSEIWDIHHDRLLWPNIAPCVLFPDDKQACSLLANQKASSRRRKGETKIRKDKTTVMGQQKVQWTSGTSLWVVPSLLSIVPKLYYRQCYFPVSHVCFLWIHVWSWEVLENLNGPESNLLLFFTHLDYCHKPLMCWRTSPPLSSSRRLEVFIELRYSSSTYCQWTFRSLFEQFSFFSLEHDIKPTLGIWTIFSSEIQVSWING